MTGRVDVHGEQMSVESVILQLQADAGFIVETYRIGNGFGPLYVIQLLGSGGFVRGNGNGAGGPYEFMDEGAVRSGSGNSFGDGDGSGYGVEELI